MRGTALAGGNSAGQDPERGPQRALRDHREDGGVLPVLPGRRPVVVGRYERALLDGLQPVAVHVAEVQLAADSPGNFLVRLERDDFDGDVVETERIVVER